MEASIEDCNWLSPYDWKISWLCLWRRISCLLLIEVVLIAGCTHNLVHLIQEYITELEMDASLKDIDLLYFEIWRLVAKENVSILIHQKKLCNRARVTCFVIMRVSYGFTNISENLQRGCEGSLWVWRVPYTQGSTTCWTQWGPYLCNDARNGKLMS